MNHYQRHLLNSTRAKYFKYKSRIEKNIANGTFQTMPRRKKRSLISKVEKFGKRLERWNMSLRGAMVAGSIAGASIMPNLATAQIDPNIYLNQSSSVSISPPRDIVAINIDQDEELELIVSTSNGGEVGNWDGKDSYEFSAPNSLTYARQLLLVGDIDGDSDMDLIFTNNGDGTYLYKGINTGVGAITSTYIGYSNRPDDIQLVDWDSDGDLDIVIASGYNYLKVFENDGSGNFSPYGGETGIFDLGGVGTIGGEGNIDSFTFADFDDDGDMDLIHNAYYPFGPYYTGSIVVLENTRDAEGVPIFDTASPAYAYQVNYNQFNNIELLDFDGDGDLDIFFGGQGTAYALSNQYIQGSAFSFNSVGITSIGENTIDDVVSGDFDNDGNDELIIANGSYNRLFSFDGSILQGIGGNLGGEIGNMTSDNDALFVADLNGDDNLDLATISIRDGEVSTYFDQGAPSLSYFSGDLIVDENTPIGHRIGTFGFSDIQEDPITVALTGDDASFFNFDIGTGELTINAELDWESKGSDLDLFFEISDGNKSRVEGGTVKINNLAEDGHGTFDPNPIKLFGNREVDFFVSGDYDMDGDADVFLTSPNSQFYNSLLQQNGGSFTDVELSAFSGPQNYAAFVHTYGGLDLVVHDIGSSEVRLSQRSESGFVDYSTLQTGIGDVDKMITGDFDGDGLYEIAIQATNASGYAIVRTFEDSNDSWISNQYFLLSNDLSTGLLDGVGDFNEIEIADFNGDGYGDMLATTVNGNDVLFLGGEYLDGGGYGFSSSFFPVITDSDGGETELAIGDIDGKGSPDIAIMRWENNVNYQIHVDFHVNDGDGSFSLHQTIALGGEFWGNIDLADIDGDGDLDLITTNLKAVGVGGGEYDFTMSIETFTNDGSGYFTAFQHIEDAGGEAFKMMDVDGDDDLDIILHADIGAEAGGENQLKVFKNINVSPTSINLSSTDFDEHLPIDTEVATISVDDLNSGDNHILSLVTGDGSNDLHNSYFTLNGNSLRLTKNVKFEDTPQLNILLSANDGHQTYEQAMVINVNDVNQAPTAIELSATSFDEHTVGGTAIATISATDANGGDTHTFELITGDGSNDTDNSKFAIEGNQLIILEQIAFEDQNSLNVYLETTDSFGNSFEQALTVTVNNINTAPTGIQLSSTTFDEGIAGGTPVATLTADDVDSGDSHTFTLASGDGSNDADNSKFLIDGDQLVIKSSPNFETQDTYNIYLSASDSEGSAEAAFVLTVNNLNSTPTGIQLSSTTFDEGIAGGTPVATLTADDVDSGDSHTFTLAIGDGSNDADNSKFLIDGDQLVIKSSPNFETQDTYNIYLSASDSEGSAEAAFVLTVNNLNSAPTGIQLSSTAFDEGIAGGTPVATLTADDVDSGDSHTFTLAIGDGSNDADNSKFLIDGDQLVIKSSPNFETQDTYNIYLSASDSEGSAEAAFVLTVNNLNSAPTGIQLSSTTFDEGIAGGTPVATLTADDVDSGDSHTFTLASGDGSNDADNSKFLIDGDQLVIKSSPNFETQDTYNIYLSASDSEGSAEAAFVLTVNNLNSAPTGIRLSSTTFDEGIAGGTPVATLTADDVDSGDSHTFTLAIGDGSNDADNSKFLIDGDQLVIKSSPNFDTQSSYNIYLRAADSEGSISQAFVITVNNTNELPSAINLSTTSLGEDTPAGSVVAIIDAIDVNTADEHEFRLVSGDGTNDIDNGKFLIEYDQLIIKQSSRFETQASYNIYLRASDSEGSIEQAFVIDVVDVNQAPTAISLSVTSLDESLSPGSTAATISATDPNAEDMHTFALIDGDGTNDEHNDLFVITRDQLILIGQIEFDDLQSININLQVSDGEEEFTQSFALTVNEVLGLNDEAVNALGVYPNPGYDRFQINIQNDFRGEMIIRVSDLLGRIIQEVYNSKQSEEFSCDIDMSSADTGIYIIEVITSREIISQRWIKK